MQESLCAAGVYFDNRLIEPGCVNETSIQIAVCAVVFGDALQAVVDEVCFRATNILLRLPIHRVVKITGVNSGLHSTVEAVQYIVAEGPDAITGEAAVAVVAVGRTANRGAYWFRLLAVP